MLKIRYIPFSGKTGLEIRDETGKHLFNLLPPEHTITSNYTAENFCTIDCQFTYGELMEAIHKLMESSNDA